MPGDPGLPYGPGAPARYAAIACICIAAKCCGDAAIAPGETPGGMPAMGTP